MLRHPLLSEDAFTPGFISKPNGTYLKDLYHPEEPEYAHDVPAPIKHLGENKESKSAPAIAETKLTAEEKQTLGKFNNQFTKLFNTILTTYFELKSEKIAHLDKDTVKLRLAQTIELTTDRNIPEQSYLYYSDLKMDLESILNNLIHNSVVSTDNKIRIMNRLFEEIATCFSGLHGFICATKLNLSTDQSVELWIAALRKTIIETIANKYWTKYCDPAVISISHVINTFLDHAFKKGLAPIDYTGSLSDIHARNIPPEACDYFEKKFFKHFTPNAIIETIIDNLIACIAAEFKKRKSEGKIIIYDKKDESDLFSLIPIANDPNIGPYYLFDPVESEDISDNLAYEHNTKTDTFCYKLKSRKDLAKSLSKKFSETITRQYFNYVKDDHFALLPSTHFCFKHSREDKTPTNQCEIISLEEVREKKLPIPPELFEFYIKENHTNFSHCTLVDIDFTEYKDQRLKSCSFNKARFIDSTISDEQYLQVFFQQDIYFEDAIGNMVDPDKLNSLTIPEKAIICFYALLTKQDKLLKKIISMEVLSELSMYMKLEEDRSHILLLFFVKKLIELNSEDNFINLKVANENNLRNFYGLILYYAIDSSNVNIATIKALLDAGANPNYICKFTVTVNDFNIIDDYSPLHLASRKGLLNVAELLLSCNANPSQLTNRQKTAIEIAADSWQENIVHLLARTPDIDNTKHHMRAFYTLLKTQQYHTALWLLNPENNIQLNINSDVQQMRISSDPIGIVNGNVILYAVSYTTLEIVKAMLARGADINASVSIQIGNNTRFISTLFLAAIKSQWNILELLVHQVSVDYFNAHAYETYYILLRLITSKKYDLINYIIDNCSKATLEYQNQHIDSEHYQYNILHHAAEDGNRALITKLLSLKIDTSQRTGFNQTATRLALKYNDFSLAQLIDEKNWLNEQLKKQTEDYPNQFPCKFHDNLKHLEHTTQILFSKLEHAMNVERNPAFTFSKNIIVNTFNSILETATEDNNIEILQKIVDVKESLRIRLSCSRIPVRQDTLNKICVISFNAMTAASALTIAHLGPALLLNFMIPHATLLLAICSIATPIFAIASISVFSMFRSYQYHQRIGEANATKPLENLIKDSAIRVR